MSVQVSSIELFEIVPRLFEDRVLGDPVVFRRRVH
jgi:hypothetical protein